MSALPGPMIKVLVFQIFFFFLFFFGLAKTEVEMFPKAPPLSLRSYPWMSLPPFRWLHDSTIFPGLSPPPDLDSRSSPLLRIPRFGFLFSAL